MKAFKGKSYVAPIEKDRKELGKYNEKLDHKFNSSRKKISHILKNQASSLGARTTTSNKKKTKFTLSDFILIGLIILSVALFIFLIFSLLLNPFKSKDTIL